MSHPVKYTAQSFLVHSQTCTIFSLLLFCFHKSCSIVAVSGDPRLGRMLLIQDWFITNFNMPSGDGSSKWDYLSVILFK